ncbi:hypothetical protein GGS24DRAFT_4555 [Hypoxylon argillaceum]|nr:hypothetical protein GGS24DRAFT_4555 [Hypoxylon argillaceum]
MADSGSLAHEPMSSAAQPAGKRRKLRKGTRSCWECKRRKNRCTWSTDEGKCDGCYHRGTQCIGQEFSEEPVHHERRKVNKPDDSRLERLEALVEQLARKVDSSGVYRDHAQSRPDDGRDEPHASSINAPNPNNVVVSLASSAASDLPDPSSYISSSHLSDDGRRSTGSILQLSLPRLLLTGSSSGQFGEATDGLVTPLVRALVAAWPSEHHHDAILKDSDAGWLHPALSTACTSFQTPPSLQVLLKLPPPGTTPVAIARKLLTLGAYIQVISSRSGQGNTGPSPQYHAIASRVLETVSKLITHNDNLPGSIEIIECLLLESHYHDYLGNIRRAWIVLRRAMAMAQILGLDRQNKTLAQNLTADEANSASHREGIWFLLVHFDQYFSLMLGISPNPVEHSQRAPEFLDRLTPSERMGRLHSMAVGRILQRNRLNIYDLAETKEIDKMLQKAAACMPAQWWSPPDWSDSGDEGFPSVIYRLMVHFAHYNILLQTHLPYMLRCLGSQQYYSFTPTAINSSREVLTSFTTFRKRHPDVSYCRGLDVFAFVASIVLCLLHIHTSSGSHIPGSYDGLGISSLLAHQRLANRGLMERALHSIERIAEVESDDNIASGIVPIFRRLLVVEEEAYRGISYNIHLPSSTDQPKSSSQEGSNSSDALALNIPFCGTIKIERANVSDTIPTEIWRSGETTQEAHILMGSFPCLTSGCPMTTPPAVQTPRDELAISTGSYQFGNHHSDITNAPFVIPYNDIDAVRESMNASELLIPELMGILDERPNHTANTDLLEGFLDIQ